MLLKDSSIFVCTGLRLVGTGLFLVGAFAFGLYSELYFLFPRHISLLCFLVRLVPYDLRVYPLCLCVRFLRPVRGEVFQILFKRMLVVEFIVIRIYKKILISSVAQFEAAVFLRNIPKAVYRKFLAENVFWADKYDVLIFKIVVEAALVQIVGIAHALVIAGAPRQVLGVGHLHLDVERTKFLPVLAELLGEHVVADAFVEGADLDRLLLDGFAEVVNFEAECSIVERHGSGSAECPALIKRIFPQKCSKKSVKLFYGKKLHYTLIKFLHSPNH